MRPSNDSLNGTEDAREDLALYLSQRLSAIEAQLASLRFDKPRIEEMFTYALTGGRRVRPFLVVLTCEALNGSLDEALRGAIAVELAHKASILHDDVVDGDAYRRGRPTFHTRYGAEQAILIGHLMIGMAYRLLEDLTSDNPALISYYQLFSHTFYLAARGQLRDVAYEDRDSLMDTQRAIEVEYEKSGSLFELSTQLGALLAAADEETLERMARFGRMLGIAFQILNDLNNLNGFEESTGRVANSDLTRRKKTLILCRAMATLSQGDRHRLNSLLEQRPSTEQNIHEISEIIVGSGALLHAHRLVERWLAEARECLSGLPDSQARRALFELADETIATAEHFGQDRS